MRRTVQSLIYSCTGRRREDVCTDGGLLLLLNARQKAQNFPPEPTDALLYDAVVTTAGTVVLLSGCV